MDKLVVVVVVVKCRMVEVVKCQIMEVVRVLVFLPGKVFNVERVRVVLNKEGPSEGAIMLVSPRLMR